ncbi:MAG: signal transduction histidine kinase, nitrogen specific, NtrB [Firmicutes bacterium]|nr:signal transduction histidine kinase, nitrogen specific, NtrB [Bacillota bacterium]
MMLNRLPRRDWTNCLVTIVIVLAACIVREIFLNSLGRSLPYVTFYPAVTLAAIYGGFYAGITAMLLSIMITGFWIIGFNQLATLSTTEWLVQAAFPLLCTIISYAIESLYRARSHDQEKTKQLLEINEELIRQKQNYQSLVENLPFIITRFDEELKFLYANPAFEKMSNRKTAEVLGKRWNEIGAQSAMYEPLISHCKTALATKKTVECEIAHTAPDETKYYHNVIIPESEKGGIDHTVLVITHDLTLQKQMQKELLRLDRLNIIGEMAASIGHELRNPLTTVRGYLQFFTKKEKFADYNEQFNTMIEELDRANSIITEFLSLAKNKAVNMECCNLNDNIHAIIPLLQADAAHSKHTIKLELSDIPNLTMDKKEIRQVLLNLVRNAIEATPSGGTITVKTERINQQVVLYVQDTGPGIPQDIIYKLGTPFVTTKDFGTGLGLSVCYRIADRHNAKLEVETSSNGTTFLLKFN